MADLRPHIDSFFSRYKNKFIIRYFKHPIETTNPWTNEITVKHHLPIWRFTFKTNSSYYFYMIEENNELFINFDNNTHYIIWLALSFKKHMNDHGIKVEFKQTNKYISKYKDIIPTKDYYPFIRLCFPKIPPSAVLTKFKKIPRELQEFDKIGVLL